MIVSISLLVLSCLALFGMIVPVQIGTSDFAAGEDDNNVLFKKLPEEIGGRKAGCIGLVLDCEADLNAGAGGNGITGRRVFDFIKSLTLALDEKNRINGPSGGALRVLERIMRGREPVRPPDLAAGAGAQTDHFRILVPFANYGGERVKDPVISNAQLKAEGALSIGYCDTSDLGAAADQVTGGSVKVTALCTPISSMQDGVQKVETGGVQNIEVHNYPAPGGEFVAKADRNAFIVIIPDDSGDDFAAGDITEVQTWINGAPSMVRVPARTVVDQFNRDRDMIDPLFAPDDVALGEADFFPLFWPSVDEGYSDVPFGDFLAKLTGNLTNVKLLTVNRDLVEEAERRRILKLIDPSEAAAKAIDAVPAEARVPVLTKPTLGGHLTLPARVRALLPQNWLWKAK